MLHRPPAPPAPSGDRHRRFRARRRNGRACYRVELDGEGLSFLIRTRWLLEAEASDRLAVGAALTRMIADAARR
jgi:hypothetical protein